MSFIESVNVLVKIPDILRTRLGERFQCSWEQYEAIYNSLKKVSSIKEEKDVTPDMLHDFYFLQELAEKARQMSVLTFEEAVQIKKSLNTLNKKIEKVGKK